MFAELIVKVVGAVAPIDSARLGACAEVGAGIDAYRPVRAAMEASGGGRDGSCHNGRAGGQQECGGYSAKRGSDLHQFPFIEFWCACKLCDAAAEGGHAIRTV